MIAFRKLTQSHFESNHVNYDVLEISAIEIHHLFYMNLPKINSTISSFLLGEEGKTSKESVLALGSMFVGSGTTMRVALEMGRNAIGIELNPNYAEIIKRRVMWNKEWESVSTCRL